MRDIDFRRKFMRCLTNPLSFLLLLALPLSVMPVYAQSGGSCDLARDPIRCKARLEAQAACQDKRGRAKQQCMTTYLPLPDCSQTEDAQRCEARQKARIQCQDKIGRDLRACLNEYGLH